jgi:hypothetical protein
MNRRIANPDSVRLASHTGIGDVNIVIASGQINTRAGTKGHVVVAGGIVKEGERSIGSVAGSSRVAQKSSYTDCRIFICSVGKQRSSAGSRIEVAFFAAFQRKETKCRIECAGGEA